MWEQIFENVSVVVLSAFNLYYGFTLSITYGHNPFQQFILLSLGSVLGVAGSLLIGTKLIEFWKNRIKRKKENNPDKKSKPNFITRIWQKYGILGVAFCTGFIGTIPTVVVALFSGVRRLSILWYLAGAKILWSIFFAYLGHAAVTKVIDWVFSA
ncbi:MAG: hypothetical protein AAFO07_03210 [Bacteroidota bacterium]